MNTSITSNTDLERAMYEAEQDTMTVNIDHTGHPAPAASRYHIKLNHSDQGSTFATGKKKDLQKYLIAYYDGREDAEEIHPEIFD